MSMDERVEHRESHLANVLAATHNSVLLHYWWLWLPSYHTGQFLASFASLIITITYSIIVQSTGPLNDWMNRIPLKNIYRKYSRILFVISHWSTAENLVYKTHLNRCVLLPPPPARTFGRDTGQALTKRASTSASEMSFCLPSCGFQKWKTNF